MLVKITRGLGGPQGVRILIITVVVGLFLFFAGWFLRDRLVSPPPPPRPLAPEEAVKLGEDARGPMPELPYAAKDLARVASPAAAEGADKKWVGLPVGTVLEVTGTQAKHRDLWVTGIVQGSAMKDNVTVHASFLERYQPLVLDKKVELSDVKMLHLAEEPVSQMAIGGLLRNITSHSISQCVVTCRFLDQDDEMVDLRRTGFLVLEPYEFIRFQTQPTEKEMLFKSFSVEISFATPDGLRDYLPTVAINRSSGPGDVTQ